MAEQFSGMPNGITRKVASAAFFAAVVLYALQVFTPLRLSTDGITYMSLADTATKTGLWTALREPGFPFPKGYPIFVFFIMKAGLFSSATLVLSNLGLFALGVFFTFRTLLALNFDRAHAQVACLLTVFAFAPVKFITQGMSDFLFLALSSCVCWLLTLNNQPYRWIGIAVCTGAAIETRFIGLSLIAPILVVAWSFLRKRIVVTAAVSGLSLSMLIAALIAGHHYLGSNVQMLEHSGLWNFAGKTLRAHSQDFGELAVNLPLSKIPGEFRAPVLVLGCIALLIFLAGVIAIRKRSVWLCAYLAAYSVLVLPWPYTDPRFWLPVMPFVILSFHEGIVMLCGALRPRLVFAYALLFCVLGFGALGYSTKLTFAGQRFAEQYGDGRLTHAYLSRCSAANLPEEKQALLLLQRYEWHCRDFQ